MGERGLGWSGWLSFGLPTCSCQGHVFLAVQQHDRRLSTEDRVNLQAHISSWAAKFGKRLTVGSLFSGSDLLKWALRCLQVLWSQRYDLHFEFEHVFSADKVPWKQAFLGAAWAPKHIFGDVVELSNNYWCGLEYQSGRALPVPSVQILVAGFECDSVSYLARDRSRNADCMEQGVEKIGQIGRATLGYLEHARPFMRGLRTCRASAART